MSMACSPAFQPRAAHYSRSVFIAYSQRAGVCSAHINSLRAGVCSAHINSLQAGVCSAHINSLQAGVCSAHINSLQAGDQPGRAHVNTLGGRAR